MNSGFLKTLALSIVLTIVLVVAVNVIGDFAVRPNPGYSPDQVAGEQPAAQKQVEAQAPAAAVVAATPVATDLSSLLASVDPADAKKAFRACKSCHASTEDGRKLVGPNLWNVVGRDKGSQEGYKYSAGLASLGGQWTYDDLDAFLSNPRGYVKGTKMAFKGFSKPEGRAKVIAYLRSLSANPKPLP